MDVTNLILYLKGTITDQTLDQQMVSKAIKLLELGAVATVSSLSSLPAPAASNAGQLYLVLYDGLYWSTGSSWYPIVQTTVSVAWSWGYNNGRLGDNTTTSRSSPVSVVGITCWLKLGTGGQGGSPVGIQCNGTAWAWGPGGSGQLGNGANANTSSPVSVIGGFSDWCQSASGNNHNVGVRRNGTAWSWGSNYFGKLGDGTTLDKNSPVSVVGGFADWCQLAAGERHTLGTRTNGSAWSWGRNTSSLGGTGQLGDNSTTNKSSPVSVVGGFADWCQLGAGRYHSVGVRSNGSAWAWGDNTAGRLGNNSINAQSSPVSVVGGFTNWCQIDAGTTHSIAIRSAGSVWTWGCNGAGQLGNNSTVNRSSPVSVVGGFADWCRIASGGAHNIAIRTNSTVWSWGNNLCGQLGNNSVVSTSSPVSIVGGFADWTDIASGYRHSFALRGSTL